MKFLQAHALLKGFSSEKKRTITLVMSGQPENLALFLRAEHALRHIDCQVETIPFNTLYQYLLNPQQSDTAEVFLLFPWDFLPTLDWRSGISEVPDDEALTQQMQAMGSLLQSREANFFYVEAPTPPLFSSREANQRMLRSVKAIALQLDAQVLSPTIFSLGSYLNFGVAIASNACGDLAETMGKYLLPAQITPRKLLVTDLDNVMWSGVIGEDGIDGIKQGPEGLGYPHFIYQTCLRKLKSEGVLLAAVSKNDPDLARAPFRQSGSVLVEEDFVAILASYEDKSTQIAALVAQLNIGLDACVFIDDNPVEIAGVSQQLPDVNCITFPARADDLVEFFARIEELFSNNNLTVEDKNRTQLYRTRLAGMLPVASGEVNLENFLRELEMDLHIFDRTHQNQDRAIQLINKTNQFNLNGIRLQTDDVQKVLTSGGRLFSASLKDKHGDHGEVIACLINQGEEVVSWVMSCRVIQRKVEQVFMAWLANHVLQRPHIQLNFLATERNTPVQQFITHEHFFARAQQLIGDSTTGVPTIYQHDRREFIDKQINTCALFKVSADIDG